MNSLSRRVRNASLAMAAVLFASLPSPSLAFGPVDVASQKNSEDCFDGIGLSYSAEEFNEALALGGQDESEFKLSRYACGSYDEDGRYEYAQCSEPRAFESFSSANQEQDGWVICLVGMLIEDDGRGFRASLDDYDAMLNTGEVVMPDPIVSGWAGNYEDLFDIDLSTEKIFSAGSLNYGLLAFPGMSSEDFVLRNLETGNEFIIQARETTLGDLIPTIAAPELGPIALSGSDFATSRPILSLGLPLRVTLKTESDRASGFGGVVSLDAEYRRDHASVLPESISLISADLIDCPPCKYSQTVEFIPEYGRVFSFQVLAEGPWTIVVEAIG